MHNQLGNIQLGGGTGWYCPGCNSYHGPHVDTCPNGESKFPQEPYKSPYPYVPLGTRECPKCGLQLTNSMMYVCSNLNCPTGLGGTATLTEVKDG